MKKYAKIAVVFNHGINDLRDINGKQDLNDRLSQYVSYMKKLGNKAFHEKLQSVLYVCESDQWRGKGKYQES